MGEEEEDKRWGREEDEGRGVVGRIKQRAGNRVDRKE